MLAEPPDSSIPTAAAELRETFRVLDVVGAGWIAVLSFTTAAPPGSPQQGDAYLCPASATGIWAGHQNHLAIFTAVGWIFRSPRLGWIAVVLDQNTPYGQVLEYTGTQWEPWALPSSQVIVQQGSPTHFLSTNLTALVAEIGARFLAGEQVDADQQTELDDHEARIATLEAAGGGGGGMAGYPGTVDDLLFWTAFDVTAASSGAIIPILANWCPWYPGLLAANTAGGASRSATQLNSKNVATFPSSSAGRYNLVAGLTLTKCTVFAVLKPSSFASLGTICSGTSGSFQLCVENGTGKIVLFKNNVATIGTATTAMTTGNWFQVNVTYDSASGAYAFRQAQAANGSGSNAQSFSANVGSIGYNPQAGSQDLAADLAELIIFNRVLSGTEIANVEAYLNTKWGV